MDISRPQFGLILSQGTYAFKVINQACIGCRPARAWFLRPDVSMCVCVCVCVCVCLPPGY